MNITIAGYGSIGHYVEEVFSEVHNVRLYDPPLGLGREDDLEDTDFLFICVPTPSLPSGECDTSIVEELVAKGRPRKAMVCHSTVSIGTTERLLEKYGKPLIFVPEYAGESVGHPYREKENREFFIFGGYGPEVEQVKGLFQSVYGSRPQYFTVPPTVGEIVKYMENAFLALKVSFCNEFFDLARAFGADFEMVRTLWLADKRVGDSHTVVTPERGYGGKCLPKDVAAVCATGRSVGIPLEILESVKKANVKHRGAGVWVG
jgi:UDPglucose 6-dehydrogenase